MKKSHLLVAAAVAAALVGVAPVAADPEQPGRPAASGGFRMTVHTHSNDDPVFSGLLFPTHRLSFDFSEGEDFSYSSRTCGGRAPFNDVGLDFRPDYPGVDDDDGTAAVRHRVAGTVTEVNGDRGTVEGTITSVLCEDQNGTQVETDDVIVTEYEVRYRRVSDNEVQVTGTFRISPTLSTGTFAGLEGRGSIKGMFTCLRQRPTCAELGYFTDFVGVRGDPTRGPGEMLPGLVGGYRDRTVEPV